MIRILYLFLLFIIVSCNEGNSPNAETSAISDTISKTGTVYKDLTNHIDSDTIREKAIARFMAQKSNLLQIEGTIGIIAGQDLKLGDSIKIIDENNREYYFVNDDEYKILALRCLSIDSRYYVVKPERDDIITGSLAYVEKSSKVIFRPWEAHVLSVAFVGWQQEQNPLRKEPDKNADMLLFDADEFYEPRQIKGEWLQVMWGNNQYGWIRWRKNDSLLIELYYFA